MMKSDEYYIKRCFKLSKKGIGSVSPNPLVGAVIVENGEIISESYHKKYGEFHAERNAINQLPDDYDFSNSTIFINLEPCTHFGKTPPCCDLLIQKSFKRIVFAMKDPNPLVAGNSIKKLKENNIECVYGILEKEAQYLNRFFIKHIQTKSPFITMKVAQSINGKIASFNYKSKWLSNSSSRKNVHKMRSQYDAILVGTNTVIQDKPSLNVRLSKGKNPKRIILDRTLSIESEYFYNSDNKLDTILITSDKMLNSIKFNKLSKEIKLITVEEINGKLDLKSTFLKLGELGINSIFIESGGKLSSSLLENNLIDEIVIYQTPKFLGKGISLFDELEIDNPNIIEEFNLYNVKRFENDVKLTYTKVNYLR